MVAGGCLFFVPHADSHALVAVARGRNEPQVRVSELAMGDGAVPRKRNSTCPAANDQTKPTTTAPLHSNANRSRQGPVACDKNERNSATSASMLSAAPRPTAVTALNTWRTSAKHRSSRRCSFLPTGRRIQS